MHLGRQKTVNMDLNANYPINWCFVILHFKKYYQHSNYWFMWPLSTESVHLICFMAAQTYILVFRLWSLGKAKEQKDFCD